MKLFCDFTKRFYEATVMKIKLGTTDLIQFFLLLHRLFREIELLNLRKIHFSCFF